MSTQVFPSLIGLGFEVTRTPAWFNKKLVSVAGLETALAYWSYPRWQWELGFDVLRSAPAYAELQTLAGFFNARQGGFDSFLYKDADDNQVQGQTIATGDGATTTFQLVRSFGGFVEPMLAPNVVSSVYLGGVPQGSGWTVASWGATNPGTITFASAPASGTIISADFSFYFPCRFMEDKISFSMFMAQMYEGKKVAFQSLKGIA